MKREVLYSAAHAGFADTEPLGGGKAVADHLIREWTAAPPFPLTVLSPRSLGLLGERDEGNPPSTPHLPPSLPSMSERQYARFCRQFERAATAEIRRRDPRRVVVLSNDISEGPDFAGLGDGGYRIVTIFHVDVVEYFTAFYLRGLIRPETAARLRWFGLLPDLLRLVFQKQFECVRHSARLVVPSEPMRAMIRRCYPWCPGERIEVVPWGNISAIGERGNPLLHPSREGILANGSPPPEGMGAGVVVPETFAEDEFVILTLSRLSPEKGIERLLRALRCLGAVNRPVRVIICGAAAYMKGRAYERNLRRQAAKLTAVRVEFPGHVTGHRKAALLHRADLFVSPSRHESYGLTIAEALAAGCRVVSHPHYGAQGQIVDCAHPRALAQVIREQIERGRTVKHDTLPAPNDPEAARRLADILAEAAG